MTLFLLLPCYCQGDIHYTNESDIGLDVYDAAGEARIITSQVLLYVCRNMVARSYNHCCSGKGISVTYSEIELIALDIQHAMRMRHIVM